MTLRLFDREPHQWSIHWSDSRTGRLYPPSVGAFAGERGDFPGKGTYDGRPIRVPYLGAQLDHGPHPHEVGRRMSRIPPVHPAS
ncbi:hypothetical protein BFF78_37650 [Streptomyces fodineus]|uniref:Uncharacterized protein n=1 Tax=Streptomyces fodineus TaxID=1904616 RepID=A0A1D7YKF8_9ACTN|nr:hypothetical protein BFF78_37650 [Streptomyces fodineus]